MFLILLLTVYLNKNKTQHNLHCFTGSRFNCLNNSNTHNFTGSLEQLNCSMILDINDCSCTVQNIWSNATLNAVENALQGVNSSYNNYCFTILNVKIQAKQEKIISRKGEWWKTIVCAVARCFGLLLGGYLMAQVI